MFRTRDYVLYTPQEISGIRAAAQATAFVRDELAAMTLPGIYAEESSKRGGAVLRIKYPWDEDWTATFD